LSGGASPERCASMAVRRAIKLPLEQNGGGGSIPHVGPTDGGDGRGAPPSGCGGRAVPPYDGGRGAPPSGSSSGAPPGSGCRGAPPLGSGGRGAPPLGSGGRGAPPLQRQQGSRSLRWRQWSPSWRGLQGSSSFRRQG
jgi:hypothetical protein